MKIFIATQNYHKIQEIQEILPEYSVTVPSKESDIPENTVSYIENALIKAKFWAQHYPDHYILADDSGLEVESLNNAPGVISSDWAGKNSTQEALLYKLINELQHIPWGKRQAKFVSYMILLAPDGNTIISRGECLGTIALEISGQKGFGYDPLFIPLGYEKPMAELELEQKNKISHRKHALTGIKEYLDYLGI